MQISLKVNKVYFLKSSMASQRPLKKYSKSNKIESQSQTASKNMSKNVCQDHVCQDHVCQDHIC